MAADEAQAALLGSRVLAAGGSAADAAVVVGLALAVTLPSRVGVSGGGACLVYDPDANRARLLDFRLHPAEPREPETGVPSGPAPIWAGASAVGAGRTPPARSGKPAASSVRSGKPAIPVRVEEPDRQESGGQAAVPTLMRALALLHGRHGRLPWAQLVAVAETLAREGHAVAPGLALDLTRAAERLRHDAPARARFFPAGEAGAPLAAGSPLVQPALAQTLSQVRYEGVQGLETGPLAAELAAGLGMSVADLKSSPPTWREVAAVPLESDVAYFPAYPGKGGQAAAETWKAMLDAPVGGWPRQLVETLAPVYGQAWAGPVGASLAVVDGRAQGVACTLTLGGLFGTGRSLGRSGLFAARPAASAGLGGPMLLVDPAARRVLLAAAAGVDGTSPLETAGSATAAVLGVALQTVGMGRRPEEALLTGRVAPGGGPDWVLVEPAAPEALTAALGRPARQMRRVAALGRVVLVACPPAGKSADACRAAADPRGGGVGLGTGPLGPAAPRGP